MIKNSALLVVIVRDARTFCPLGRAQGQEAHDRLHHRSSEGQYAGRPGRPDHHRNEFQRQRWRGILADLSAIRVTNDPCWMIVALLVIKQYAQKYPTLTDAEAKAMADEMLECDFSSG